jgi:hypothetical protein
VSRPRTFARTAALLLVAALSGPASIPDEVGDARVYGGDHRTTGGTDDTALGDDLAA